MAGAMVAVSGRAGDSGTPRPGMTSPLQTHGVIEMAILMRLPLRFPSGVL